MKDIHEYRTNGKHTRLIGSPLRHTVQIQSPSLCLGEGFCPEHAGIVADGPVYGMLTPASHRVHPKTGRQIQRKVLRQAFAALLNLSQPEEMVLAP